MKQVIKLGDCGWSYITENEEAADAIERVVYVTTFEGFSTSDYNELSPEAKKVFDGFARYYNLWITPYNDLIWEETLKRRGWNINGEEMEYEGYSKWNLKS